MNLSEREAELVLEMQAELVKAKAALNVIEAKAAEMARINNKAGRLTAGNAAMRFGAGAKRVGGALGEVHADAFDALCDCFEDGGIVAMGGGGGR